MPSGCTIYRHCFYFFSPFPNRLKCRQNAPFTILVFKNSRKLPMSSRSLLFWYKTCINFVIAVTNIVQNSVKRQALVTLVSKCWPHFKIVSNAARMHPLPSLFSKVTLQLQIVSNTIRMYHLRYLFSNFLGGYPRPHVPPCFSTQYVLFFLLQFQIYSKNSIKMQALVHVVFKMLTFANRSI